MIERKVLSKEIVWPSRGNRKAFKWRWINLVLGLMLFSVACLRGEAENAYLSFIVGAIGGLLIDFIGVKQLNLYAYPGQKFFTQDYLCIVIPSWGVFGMLINLPWNWFLNKEIEFVSLTLFTIILIILFELSNLKSKSWEYYIPAWIVFIGWVPMVIALRISFCLTATLFF